MSFSDVVGMRGERRKGIIIKAVFPCCLKKIICATGGAVNCALVNVLRKSYRINCISIIKLKCVKARAFIVLVWKATGGLPDDLHFTRSATVCRGTR